jgi:predicted metal-dependent hydrolase
LSLPDYTFRHSKKAKYLQLRFSSRLGLQVVLPFGTPFEKEAIERFITTKKDWIERNIARFNVKPLSQELPTHIPLEALEQTWQIFYEEKNSAKLSLQEKSQCITLSGNIKNEALCVSLLQNWLKNMAIIYLIPQLKMLSIETGLDYQKVTIRNNQTRFGSCSTKKHISLCCKLLFLPKRLVRHVLLHELCHTQYMHHGKSFWKRLTKFDPHTELHVKELKKKALQIPLWAGRR